QTMLDFAKDSLDRAEKEKRRLQTQLETAVTALQSAVNNLSAAVKEHYNCLTAIDRLRVHVKENILYYMQAIWSHEPPDQRFFRLYNIDVPMVEFASDGVMVEVMRDGGNLTDDLLGRDVGAVELPLPETTIVTRKLVDVADLDEVL